MEETLTLGLNSDLPKNVAGTLSGTADSESFGPFPRIPKPQTNTSPSSTEAKNTKQHQFVPLHNSCVAGTIQQLCIQILKPIKHSEL